MAFEGSPTASLASNNAHSVPGKRALVRAPGFPQSYSGSARPSQRPGEPKMGNPCPRVCGTRLDKIKRSIAGSDPSAAALLLRHLRSQAASFNRAKGSAVVAAGLGFLVWFFGFMVIGGEWFQMWQSSQWNGQEAAFRFYLTILAVLIFVMQKDE